MIRTVDEWEKLLKPLLTNNIDRASKAILGDLVHYGNGRSYESDDIIQLSNAMQAYHIIMEKINEQ